GSGRRKQAPGLKEIIVFLIDVQRNLNLPLADGVSDWKRINGLERCDLERGRDGMLSEERALRAWRNRLKRSDNSNALKTTRPSTGRTERDKNRQAKHALLH